MAWLSVSAGVMGLLSVLGSGPTYGMAFESRAGDASRWFME